MATETTYYGLTKPAANDYYDIAQFNRNMDLIDTAVHNCVHGEEAAALLHLKSGTYTGTGSTANRRQIIPGAAIKAILIFKDGVPAGFATASVPYLSGTNIRLQIDGTAFILGGGFCNAANTSYGYAIFY